MDNNVILLQMLKYVGSQQSSASDNSGLQAASSASTTVSDSEATFSASNMFDNSISTRIVVSDTDVQHSGTYNCEPGAAPVASVNVHVLDGKIYSRVVTVMEFHR